MEGSACLHDGYQGPCKDYPWLCDTSCCISPQDSRNCDAGCQDAYASALNHGYQSAAHRIVTWSNIKHDIVDDSAISFNSNINQCFTSAAGRLYGNDRIFSSYSEMILEGYDEYGCPPLTSCQWATGERNGMSVLGMLCIPSGGSSFNDGGDDGGITDGSNIQGGLGRNTEYSRVHTGDLTYDPIQPD